MEHPSQTAREPVPRGRRVLVGVAVLAAVGAGALLLVDALVSSPLEPRDPSTPDVGVLAGAVAEVPPEGSPQREVVLRFERGGTRHEVPTGQGGAFSLELPPGTYAVTTASGRDVCPSQVEVRAGAWQRNDLLWPCHSSRTGGPPAEIPAPPPVDEPP